MNNHKKHNNSSKKKDNSKKTDGDDEESKGFIEEQVKKENTDKISILENQVTAMKGISMGLTNQISEDKTIISKLDGGFDKTKMLVGKTLGKLDDMVTKGSNSMCTYVVIFVIMLLALLYKLG